MLYRTNEVDGGLIIKAMNLDSWKVIIRELFLAHSMSARRNVINDISDVENWIVRRFHPVHAPRHPA